jgi:hypothetical protein
MARCGNPSPSRTATSWTFESFRQASCARRTRRRLHPADMPLFPYRSTSPSRADHARSRRQLPPVPRIPPKMDRFVLRRPSAAMEDAPRGPAFLRLSRWRDGHVAVPDFVRVAASSPGSRPPPCEWPASLDSASGRCCRAEIGGSGWWGHRVPGGDGLGSGGAARSRRR